MTSQPGWHERYKRRRELKDEAKSKFHYWLIDAGQKSQQEFDKSILVLSGGAFGVTLTFLKDVIGDHDIAASHWLYLAWVFWATSMIFVVMSFSTSSYAHDRAVEEFKRDPDAYDHKTAGGQWGKATEVFTFASGLFCILGFVLISLFVTNNSLGGHHASRKKETCEKNCCQEVIVQEVNIQEKDGQETGGKKHYKKETRRKETSNKETRSKEASCQEASSKETSSKETSSKETSSKETTSKETTGGEEISRKEEGSR